MNHKEDLAKRLFVRVLIGALPLAFLGFALFETTSSGYSGMAPNVNKFLPILLVFGWAGFLLIEALYFLSKTKSSHALVNLCAILILGAAFLLLMYSEQA